MKYQKNKGDVADICYKHGKEYTLEEKVSYLLKVEELIKKAHEKGFILNDVAIWNFLVTENNDVLGIDVDNFQFNGMKSETKPTLYLKYYQELCQTNKCDENSDKFSFALLALKSLMEYPIKDENFNKYDKKYDTALIRFNQCDISTEVKDDIANLLSNNPEKEWIGKTLQKVASYSKKFI